MRGKKHPEPKRARVIAALLLGGGVMEIARQFNLPESSVRNYKRSLPSEQLAEINARKGQRIDELVYDCIVESLLTTRAQAIALRNESYTLKQPASEMATLYGVIADKSIRLLEAATRARLPIVGELPAAPAA